MTSVPSIGYNNSKLTLVQEFVQLPKSRKEIISTIGTILEKGGVQKLVVEIGKPISVSRLLKEISSLSEDPGIPKDIIDDDLMSAVRT
jgi:hypothetical protein